mgnify:CR=1 FL=1
MELSYKVHQTILGEEIQEKDPDTGRIIAVISSEAIDRDGEIVSAAAMKAAMPGFMKNPVVLAAHTHRLGDGKSPVVGKVIRWWQEKDKTLAEIEFAETPLGMEYRLLYRGRFQIAFSIGFGSLKRVNRIINGQSVPVHDEIEMYELSVVPVPSNPEALTKALQDRIEKSLAAIDKTLREYQSVIESKTNDILERLEDIAALQTKNPDDLGEAFSGNPSQPAGGEKTNPGLFGRIAITKEKE